MANNYKDIVEERLRKNIHPTTEGMFGFTKQPDAQCPAIDDVINILNEQSKEVKSAIIDLKRVEDIDSYILSSLDNVEYELRTIDIEQFRTVIIQLREWGQQWKDFAKDLINNNNLDIEDYIHGI